MTLGFIDSTFLRICADPRIADLCRFVDVVVALYFSYILLDVLVYDSCCINDDWYNMYSHILHSLTLNLEIHIFAHLLCFHLLDVVVTWDCHIYDLASISLFLLYDCVWFVAGDMSVSDDLGVPQDSYFVIFCNSFRLMLLPVLCLHFDAIVLAYVQVQWGSYLVVPVKVLICC